MTSAPLAPAGVDGSGGLFVGLATLDLVLGVDHVPGADEKVVATSQLLAAGGPAANAAVAFAWAGGGARLVTALGSHPFAGVAADDLRANGVVVEDATIGRAVADRVAAPPVAAILVTERTGQRAVVSRTDRGLDGDPPTVDGAAIASLLDAARIVAADGHHVRLAEPVLRAARERGIPVLLDAGSWRPAFATLLPLADVVVASAGFRPGVPANAGVTADADRACDAEAASGADPASDADTVLAYLLDQGPRFAARTDGAGRIRWCDSTGRAGAVDVPPVVAVDTLGAGDVLHGVMAAVIAGRAGDATPDTTFLVGALAEGARVASASCAFPGTRAWLAAGIPRPALPGSATRRG